MNKMIILQGLPGSGKTTWANNWYNKDRENRAIVCKDDIAMALAEVDCKCDLPFDRPFRKKVREEQRNLIQLHLRNGKDVCIADTNLSMDFIFEYIDWGNETGVDYEVEVEDDFLDIPLMEILDRNEKRGCDRVPESVIFEMYNNYIKGRHFVEQNDTNPKCVVFDMDGTLAEKGDRSIYEWDKVGLDTPNESIVELAQMYFQKGYRIIIVSARQATKECTAQTLDWLNRYHIPVSNVFMRREGDTRRDWVVKEEILKTIIKDNYIHLWVDDRFQVATHIRSLGINVIQCKDGRY